jgi:cell division transport system permease protein
MRLGFFLREALRAMRRNRAPSIAALATIVVTLIVIGVFIPVVQATQGAANGVRSRVLVDVYLKTHASGSEVARVKSELTQLPNVQRVVFESKQAALRQESKQDRAAYKILSYNPLPDTFHVYPDNPSDALSVRAAIMHNPSGGKGMMDAAIATVSNHQQDTKKLLEVTRLVTITAGLLALLLTIASVLLIGNTIRLSLYARRREVEVMKLVGATDWFIRWPFVIEGTIVGATGAVLAIGVLAVAKFLLLDPLSGSWTLISAPSTIPFVPLMVVLVGAGIAVSAVGSGLSLRRFLRI